MAFTVKTSNYFDGKYVVETVTRGVGTTLKTWYGHVQVMSDMWEGSTYVTYWDEEKQTVQTEAWAEDVVVDATPEVFEKVRAFIYNRQLELYTERAQNEARTMVKGSVVKVVSGRTAKGVEGPVVVVIQRPYGMGYRANMENKFAIATSDVMVDFAAKNGKVYKNHRDVVWVWARNCELVNIPEIDMADVEARAKEATSWEFKNHYGKDYENAKKAVCAEAA